MSPFSKTSLAFWCVVGTAVFALAVPRAAVALPSTNSGAQIGSGSQSYTNSDARTATDFHFVYKLANSDATPPYYFDSATFTTVPAGTVSATPILTGGLVSGYTVNVTALSIPTGGTIQVNANAKIHNAANSGAMSGWTFTYATGAPVSCAPDWTFRYQYDAILPVPGLHTVHYLLVNDDLTRTITLSSIAFRLDTLWRAPGTALPTSTPFQIAAGPIVLPPGVKHDVILNVPGTGSAKSFIYASGTMTFTGGGGASPIAFDNRHEEAFYPTAVPSLSTWGAIAAALLLASLAGFALLRRRNALA